jgi:hypothetical protein
MDTCNQWFLSTDLRHIQVEQAQIDIILQSDEEYVFEVLGEKCVL